MTKYQLNQKLPDTNAHSKTEQDCYAPAFGNTMFIFGIFLATRVLLLLAQWFVVPESGGTDVALYANYAKAQEMASREGQTVFHVRAFEYPPLAIIPMVVPSWFLSSSQEETDVSNAYLRKYRAIYRLEMAICDLMCFVCLLVLIAKCFPKESNREKVERAMVYVLGGVILGSIVHTRLDIMLTVLLALGLLCLLSRGHYFGSFVVLSASIAFKFVPLILVPVWIVASLPKHAVVGLRKMPVFLRMIEQCGRRLILLIILTMVWILPFYIFAGGRIFAFFQYHKTRGIEITSLYGTIIVWFRHFGTSLEVYSSHQSMDVRNSFSSWLAHGAPWLTGGFIVLAVSLLAIKFVRVRQQGASVETATVRLGTKYRTEFVAFLLVFLWIFIVFNKVLSPQYLLWLLPFVSLVPLRRNARLTYFGMFLLVCALTSLISPIFWDRSILGRDIRADGSSVLLGPTVGGTVLLTARNVLLLGLLIWSLVFTWGRSRRKATLYREDLLNRYVAHNQSPLTTNPE